MIIVKLKKPTRCDCVVCATMKPKRLHQGRKATFAPESILRLRVPVIEGGWDGEAWCDEHAPKDATIVDEDAAKEGSGG